MASSAPAFPPSLSSTWLGALPSDCDFSLHNIPFGVAKLRVAGAQGPPVCVTRVGGWVLDLCALSGAGLLPASVAGALAPAPSAEGRTLNALMALGRPGARAVRARVQELLRSGGDAALEGDAALRARAVVAADAAEMCLPARVPNYTDFYSSREHASAWWRRGRVAARRARRARGVLVASGARHRRRGGLFFPPPPASSRQRRHHDARRRQRAAAELGAPAGGLPRPRVVGHCVGRGRAPAVRAAARAERRRRAAHVRAEQAAGL
jgi:hypothetical protein